MPPKRKSESASGGSGKVVKQTTLSFAKKPVGQSRAEPSKASAAVPVAAPGAAAAPSGSAPAAAEAPNVHQGSVEEVTVVPLLSREAVHMLEQKAEDYRTVWGDKCHQRKLASSTRMAVKDEADLDGAGIAFLESCKLAFQQASRHNLGLPRDILDMLVLVLRNDVLHKHPQVSRQAYSLLHSYLQLHPPASVGTNAEGWPCVVTSRQRLPEFSAADPSEHLKHVDNFWPSLETDLQSFSCKYLRSSDINVSGQNWKQAQSGAEPDHSCRLKCAFELLRHLFEEAAQSDEVNRDGDLLLLRYLLGVLGQDLRCRMAVFNAHKDAAVTDDAVLKRLKNLLINSLLWRITEDGLVKSGDKLQLTRLLMRLISGGALSGGDAGADDDEEEAAVAQRSAPGAAEEANAADQCLFGRQQLAAMAAQLLRMQLELHGAIESASGFLSVSRSRAASTNLRMQLDSNMLLCFWGKESVCVNDELSRNFLRCLAPRDRLRFLGMLVAQLFKGTYKERPDLGSKLLALQEAERLLGHGGDAAQFVDVNMLQAIQSITSDQPRLLKVYRNVNLLAVVVSNIALALHALAASGSALLAGAGHEGAPPPLGGTLGELCCELQAALRCVVDKSGEGTQFLGEQSKLELVHAQMAVSAMA